MARTRSPLAAKQWIPLPDGTPQFDQTGGALASLDSVPLVDGPEAGLLARAIAANVGNIGGAGSF